jgi:hypothetical protein
VSAQPPPRQTLTKWRSSGPPPTPADHAREDAFLDEHVNGGALIHLTTSRVLAAAMPASDDRSERARLALRVFSEYVQALEILGGWGWAIRNRSSAPLLLDAFLSYTPNDPKAFYEIVENHTGELSALLSLPPTQEITDAFRASGVPHAALLAEFGRAEHNLTQAAGHYFRPDEIFVANYNKAKHGAPIVLDPADDESYFVLAPNLLGPERYTLTRFSMSEATTERTLGLIEQVSNTTRALVSFARNLKTAGLLY